MDVTIIVFLGELAGCVLANLPKSDSGNWSQDLKVGNVKYIECFNRIEKRQQLDFHYPTFFLTLLDGGGLQDQRIAVNVTLICFTRAQLGSAECEGGACVLASVGYTKL